MMRWVIFCFLHAIVFIANAQESPSASCEPLPLKSDSLVLKPIKPVVVLIHNISETELWMTHPETLSGASAGWSSRLEAENWSALVVDKKSFELNCIESRPGHEQQVPCPGMITVCQWPGVKIPAKFENTFWAAENLPLTTLIAELGGRGFKIPLSFKNKESPL